MGIQKQLQSLDDRSNGMAEGTTFFKSLFPLLKIHNFRICMYADATWWT